MMPRVLIIEDDRNIQKLLSMNFSEEGFQLLQAFDGAEGLNKALELKPDLIILDINLPKMKGVDLCKRLKTDKSAKDIPIIILTVRNDEVDRIVGFEVGADDYVTKPFSVRELILRAEAVLRRKKEKKPERKIKAGEIILDESGLTVSVSKKPLPLTATEFKLLKYFLLNKERVLSRDVLLSNVWGYGSEIDTRTVDAHVRSLRKKLRTKKAKIVTVIGMGYRLTEDV